MGVVIETEISIDRLPPSRVNVMEVFAPDTVLCGVVSFQRSEMKAMFAIWKILDGSMASFEVV